MAKAEGFPYCAAAASVEDALKLLSEIRFDHPPRILIAGSLFLAAHVLAANGSQID
jgi:dihydrofolate synthase/folylpolyglutamate synthase